MNNDDIFASAGGSLLNDLLSDLDSAVKTATASISDDDGGDDVLASLERELASSYANPPDGGDSGALFPGGGPPPGMASGGGMMGSSNAHSQTAAAFVVGHQSHRATQMQPPPMTPPFAPGLGGRGGGGTDDWASALSNFGGMSLAADFLAADSAKKGNGTGIATPNPTDDAADESDGLFGDLSSDMMGRLFDDEEEYDAEEKVMLGGGGTVSSAKADGTPSKPKAGRQKDAQTDGTGGLLALLGASRASKPDKAKTPKSKQQQQRRDTGGNISVPPQEPNDSHPSGPAGTKAPPPSPMIPPRQMTVPMGSPHGHPMPPLGFGGPPQPHGMLPPQFPGGMMPPPGPPRGPHPNMGPNMGPPGGGGGMMHPMMMGPPMNHPNYNGGRPPFMGGPFPQPPQHHMQGRGPPPPHQPRGPLPPQQPSSEKESVFENKDFPALGAKEEEKSSTEPPTAEADPAAKENPAAAPPVEESMETPLPVLPVEPYSTSAASRGRVLFNNPHPRAPPIPGAMATSSLMPARDVCYVVHSMLRPLQSLDAYNDDYYHWSFVDRQSRNLLVMGGGANEILPNPVWKEVKVMAKAQEDKFREVVETRAKDWSEEKRILGHTVKTNVNRPRALLSTPVLNKENAPFMGGGISEEESKENTVSDYEAEQERSRVSLWSARMAIDKGYSSYLTLVELRRLIQANNGSSPQLVQDLMGDVKNNVDLLHASFGIQIEPALDGSRQIVVDKVRLSSALSLPKGRVLCARVIEGGILPHPSACEILPPALHYILSSALSPSPAGEDRLLRALTGLVHTVRPFVEPRILCSCLDVSISIGKGADGGGQKSMTKITGRRARMELVHSILSRGKVVCADAIGDVWMGKEKEFMELLSTSMAAGGQSSA